MLRAFYGIDANPFSSDEVILLPHQQQSRSGSQALRMGTTRTAHRRGVVSAVAGPGTVYRS